MGCGSSNGGGRTTTGQADEAEIVLNKYTDFVVKLASVAALRKVYQLYQIGQAGSKNNSNKVDASGISAAFGLRKDIYVDRLAKIWDEDRDGYCDFREFLVGLGMFGRHPDETNIQLRFCYRLLDLDQDGIVSLNEMMDAIETSEEMFKNSKEWEHKTGDKFWGDKKAIETSPLHSYIKPLKDELRERNVTIITFEEFVRIAGKYPRVVSPQMFIWNSITPHTKPAIAVIDELRSRRIHELLPLKERLAGERKMREKADEKRSARSAGADRGATSMDGNNHRPRMERGRTRKGINTGGSNEHRGKVLHDRARGGSMESIDDHPSRPMASEDSAVSDCTYASDDRASMASRVASITDSHAGDREGHGAGGAQASHASSVSSPTGSKAFSPSASQSMRHRSTNEYVPLRGNSQEHTPLRGSSADTIIGNGEKNEAWADKDGERPQTGHSGHSGNSDAPRRSSAPVGRVRRGLASAAAAARDSFSKAIPTRTRSVAYMETGSAEQHPKLSRMQTSNGRPSDIGKRPGRYSADAASHKPEPPLRQKTTKAPDWINRARNSFVNVRGMGKSADGDNHIRATNAPLRRGVSKRNVEAA
mmetsp:Transcript_60079/g.190853  ORF Transcript_60079/g.190853 Transcript_60079/m.190853 type:complete len:592 (+) Transcript_60079:214-1989(+)